jgi:hypothetical protein
MECAFRCLQSCCSLLKRFAASAGQASKSALMTGVLREVGRGEGVTAHRWSSYRLAARRVRGCWPRLGNAMPRYGMLDDGVQLKRSGTQASCDTSAKLYRKPVPRAPGARIRLDTNSTTAAVAFADQRWRCQSPCYASSAANVRCGECAHIMTHAPSARLCAHTQSAADRAHGSRKKRSATQSIACACRLAAIYTIKVNVFLAFRRTITKCC